MARRNSTESLAMVYGLLLLGWALAKRKPGLASPFRHWSSDDAESFVRELQPLGVPLPAVLNVYAAESGLDPKASSGIAWGLCQAIGSTLRQVGWTRPPKDFGRLTVTEQAPWIAKVLAWQIKAIGFTPKTALELYVANFSPLAAAHHSDVLYRSPSMAYEKNQHLDHGDKGFIDRNDLALALAAAAKREPYRTTLAQISRLTDTKLATG